MIDGRISAEQLCDLVSVVVADDALVLGQSQLTALICGQRKRGQEAGSQSVDRGVVVGNCKHVKQWEVVVIV